MDLFSDLLLRLKHELRTSKDQEVAAALGLSKTAFSERKKRGSFPERELLALAEARPELGIDTHYVLTGERLKDSVAEAIRTLPERVREIRGAMSEAEFAGAWGIEVEQLAQVESGQRPPTVNLLKRLAEMYPDDANYLMTGVRPEIAEPLTAREIVLVTNYRASSDEGREALTYQANFFAQYNADHAPVEGKKIIEGTASLAAQPKAAQGGRK